MLTKIQRPTITVWAIRKVGVPKKRAKSSAFLPNQSPPKADSRWACGRWNLRTCSCSASPCCTLIPLSLCFHYLFNGCRDGDFEYSSCGTLKPHPRRKG